MFLTGLDESNQKILQLLTENARISYSEIGERIGISRAAVTARVKEMEEQGIIEAYTVVINPQRVSGAISSYIEIEAAPEALPMVVNRLDQNDMVTQVYRMTGSCKLHVHAVAANQEEMERFLHDEIDQLPGLVQASCNIILSRIKDIKGLRL